MALESWWPLDPVRAGQPDGSGSRVVLSRHVEGSPRKRQCSGKREELEDSRDAVAVATCDVEQEADLFALALIPSFPPPGDETSRCNRRAESAVGGGLRRWRLPRGHGLLEGGPLRIQRVLASALGAALEGRTGHRRGRGSDAAGVARCCADRRGPPDGGLGMAWCHRRPG